MALDKDFLTPIFEGIEGAEERIGKILKEYEADITGLKVNKDQILNESKATKDKLDKLNQEREAEKAELLKRIEEMEKQIKDSSTEATMEFYEAEKKKIEDMYAAKFAEQDRSIKQRETAYTELNAEYLKLMRNNELDRAIDGIQNLDNSKKNILRDVFLARNQFELQTVDGEKKMLNKDFRTIPDALNAFIATDEGKLFVLANSSGGNATGGNKPSIPSTPNPWAKETLNLTQQMIITKEQPALAKSLMAAAGVRTT